MLSTICSFLSKCFFYGWMGVWGFGDRFTLYIRPNIYQKSYMPLHSSSLCITCWWFSQDIMFGHHLFFCRAPLIIFYFPIIRYRYFSFILNAGINLVRWLFFIGGDEFIDNFLTGRIDFIFTDNIGERGKKLIPLFGWFLVLWIVFGVFAYGSWCLSICNNYILVKYQLRFR